MTQLLENIVGGSDLPYIGPTLICSFLLEKSKKYKLAQALCVVGYCSWLVYEDSRVTITST